PPSTLPPFPYTTLFRSKILARRQHTRDVAFHGEVIEQPAAFRVSGFLAGCELPPPNCGIDIERIELQAATDPLYIDTAIRRWQRSEEHTSELQSHLNLV